MRVVGLPRLISFSFFLLITARLGLGQGFEVVLEAEDMEIKTIGAPIPEGWNLYGNGYIANPMDFPEEREYLFQIRAKGSYAGGKWPLMEIRIDDTVLGPIVVDTSDWGNYSITSRVSPDRHWVAIAFINDYYDPFHGDRNLYVDKVVITFSETNDRDWLIRLANSILLKKTNPANYALDDWTIVALMYGLLKTYEVTEDPRYLEYIRFWVDAHVDEYGNLDIDFNDPFKPALSFVDPGVVILWLYEVTAESKYLTAASSIADFLLTQSERTSDQGFVHLHEDQLWIDTLNGLCQFLGMMGKITGDGKYFDEAANQVIIHANRLMDATTGLFYHGWDEDGSAWWADPITHRSPCLWARGNGWAIMGIVDLLEYLPSDHPKREDVLTIFQSLVAGIAQYQDSESGLWYTIMDEGGRAGNYLETSASSLFVYGIQKGINQGYVSSIYQKNVNDANKGLNRRIYINAKGLAVVTGVSAGTRPGDYNYYVSVPTGTGDDYPYGDGVFLEAKAMVSSLSYRKFSIEGNIFYYSNNAPVPNVTLSILEAFLSNTTNNNGHYQFTDLRGNQNYTISPSKPPDNDVGEFTILTYDAALTAQAAVGLRQLTPYQTIAADVNKDGKIYTYDAALIARYAVGLPKLPSSHVGEWVFVPDSIRYEPLDSDKTDQNFVGILLGDVHGGWSPPGRIARREIKPYAQLNDMMVYAGEQVVIPLSIRENQGMISCDISLKYNPKVLKFVKVNKTMLTQRLNLVYSNNQGRLRIGLYGITPINKAGKLINVIFQVIGKPGQISSLFLERYQINDGPIESEIVSLRIANEEELPKHFSLEQNYPNPFNSQTTISYQIPKAGKVIIKVYNLLGQEVKTLVNSVQQAGYHEASWDGKDRRGEDVPTGIYLCWINYNGHTQCKRLIKLK